MISRRVPILRSENGHGLARRKRANRRHDKRTAGQYGNGDDEDDNDNDNDRAESTERA